MLLLTFPISPCILLDNLNGLALQQNQILANRIGVTWFYTMNIPYLSSDHLADVQTGLNNFNKAINSTMQQDAQVQNVKASTPVNFVTTYLQRIVTERTELIILTFVTLGLLLLFTILMSGLLIDRQSEMIAILRSRGASQHQVFSAFSLQGLLLGIIALLVGPLLAPLLTRRLTQVLFAGKNYDALNLIARPLEAGFSVRWYALAAALTVIGAMTFSLYQALQLDILHLRRETTRTRRRSLLQRMNWDVATLLIAFIIYDASLYIESIGLLDPQLSVSGLGPLTFVASLAVLRALGCTPRQVASALSIELMLVYSAIILGGILGLIFAFQTVPHLVFTDASGASSSGQVFLTQSVPAARAIIPNTLVLLLALFILLCLSTLALMVYTVSRLATDQTLRVNED